MCGIVGYIGSRNAYDILIKGLHRLEYRGYDSAGVALINPEEKLNVYKAKGKVSDLENAAKNQDLTGTIGIAHTRWATHGEPSVRNAHPHVSESGNLAIVHNGIIENYSELREQLKGKGIPLQKRHRHRSPRTAHRVCYGQASYQPYTICMSCTEKMRRSLCHSSNRPPEPKADCGCEKGLTARHRRRKGQL